jgi:hypothetical protein
MEGFGFIILALLVTLFVAWIVNLIIGMLSGDQPGDTKSLWWDIFSKMNRGPMSYSEPLPDFLEPGKVGVGDLVRVRSMPLEVERSMSNERRELLRNCVGKELRVESVDEFGSVDLYVLDNGTQAPDRSQHVIFVDQEHVDLVRKA